MSARKPLRRLYIDLETYSHRDIKKVSTYTYAECPHFMILMAAWAIDDEPVQVAFSVEEILSIALLWDGPVVMRVAHNAPFERICLSQFLVNNGYQTNSGARYLPPEEWDDTMMRAAEWGWPKSLEQLAKALNVTDKDPAGSALISWFCKPDRNGNRRLPEDHPEKWEQFVAYCVQDVETLREIDRALQDWPTPNERLAWLADQAINDRGIPVDVEMATPAVAESEDNQMMSELEFSAITGVDNPGSISQVGAWLKRAGHPLPNLQKETVEAKLNKLRSIEDPDDMTLTVTRALEIRQELALVASKKYTAAVMRTSPDNRLRGAFKFFGAHTGRWAGSGVQLQNLPSETLFEKHHTEQEREDIVNGAIVDLKMGEPMTAKQLKALVRAMFVGPFAVVDYASIEARVLAWMAGEDWALDAFRAGRDIYVETAERMSTPGNTLDRKQGKVAVLALGYNGGINSLRAMGGTGTDEQLQFLVSQWRTANSNITSYWYQMQDSFRNGGEVGDWVRVERDGKDRYIVLPSGRSIGYHNVQLRWVEKWGKRVQQLSFADPKGPGIRTDTYGGRLTENVTQAIARDILAEALVRLEDAGQETVGHVHDEILVRNGDVDTVTKIMTQQPLWAPGLPLGGEGFTCSRYRKG